MTATAQRFDALKIAERADKAWCRRTTDEPAPPEYLKIMADAFRPLAEQATGQVLVPPVDESAVKLLQADKQRLEDGVADLRKENVDLLTALRKIERDQAEAKKSVPKPPGVDEARAERDTALGLLKDARSDNTKLADQLAALRKEYDEQNVDLTAAHAALDEVAAEHHHTFELDVAAGATEPSSCTCGLLYPRTNIRTATSPPPPALDLFEHLRATGWPRKGGA